jgi:biotin carboxylase
MMQKKILMLGGSYFQVPSIITAVKLGYYVISCDYLPNNPGHKYAHEYYNVSTTDKEGVLKLAKKLKVNGIVCYASDPSASTAAYVAEKMGLSGNPYSSVEILTNKDLFRNFLLKHNFNVPKAKGYYSYKKALIDFNDYKMPVMIKPTDSSGSKGITKISSKADLKKAIEFALSFSRIKRFIIEEFIDKDGYQISGDGFLLNGKLAFRCFGNGHFDKKASNPFVPIGSSYPCVFSIHIQNRIHNELQRLFTLLKMRIGACNFDIVLDKNKNIYFIEIGARNGGNSIPQVIRYATGVDMVEYTIKAAMNENCHDLKMVRANFFWSTYLVHSEKTGKLKEVQIDDNFKKNNLVEFDMFIKNGEMVYPYSGSNTTLGVMIIRYFSQIEMLEMMKNMQKWVKVIVE